MTKKIYLETLKSVLGHSILHYCLWWVFMFVLQLFVFLRLVAIILSQWFLLWSIYISLHLSLVNDEFLIHQKYCICKPTGICHFSRTKIQIFLSQRIWYVKLIFNSCLIYHTRKTKKHKIFVFHHKKICDKYYKVFVLFLTCFWEG